MRNLLLGFDIGSSSVKATLLNADTGQVVATVALPDDEMLIVSPQKDWAEQDPEMWWKYVKLTSQAVSKAAHLQKGELKAIGISYQMHGLVLVNKNLEVLRPSIIWCDSRAVNIGNQAFKDIGEAYCLSHFLNSPGNFTASKLKWVQINEPDLYQKIYKAMLPGDFIGMKMTGEIHTTVSGLSEGIFWDFKEQSVSNKLLDYLQIDKDILPEALPSFSFQGKVTPEAAEMMGLYEGVPVTYRAGDQPNNAYSLNVLNEGEIATTAGTSGTMYAVSESPLFDEKSRVNSFVHVNHTSESPKNGVLLCVNGTGISNSWLRKILGENISYPQMNELASVSPIGAEGLSFLPFGNGAERILENQSIGAHLIGLNVLKHERSHVIRATQEGIACALAYGFSIMKDMGIALNVVKAGHANMFLSPLFREAFVQINQVSLKLMDTDGSQGAARGAGVGAGIYATHQEAFIGLKTIMTYSPNSQLLPYYQEVYERWSTNLLKLRDNQ